MSIQDPLGDMLTRIRNAQMRGKSKVACPASKLRGRVLDVLKSCAGLCGFGDGARSSVHVPDFAGNIGRGGNLAPLAPESS